jgi:hypothetical protein
MGQIGRRRAGTGKGCSHWHIPCSFGKKDCERIRAMTNAFIGKGSPEGGMKGGWGWMVPIWRRA